MAAPAPAPIDNVIINLNLTLGSPTVYFNALPPAADEPMLKLGQHVGQLDLDILKPITQAVLKSGTTARRLKQEQSRAHIWCSSRLLRCLTSNDFVPILARWKTACFDDPQTHGSLMIALGPQQQHSEAIALLLASCAISCDDVRAGRTLFNHPQRTAILTSAEHVKRLFQSARPHATVFVDECIAPDVDMYILEFCARTILTVFKDLQNNQHGFYHALLNSIFANPMTREAREARKTYLGLDDNKVNAVEWETPSIQLHRVAYAYGCANAVRSRNEEARNNYARDPIIKATCRDMMTRFTSLQRELNTEANQQSNLDLTDVVGPSTVIPPAHLPPRITAHRAVCTLGCQNNEVPVLPPGRPKKGPLPERVAHSLFLTISLGRVVVPSNRISGAPDSSEPWSDLEKLALFTRFREVATIWDPSVEGVAEEWWAQWCKVVEVLPGRSMTDCVIFYNAHRQDFRN